MFGSFLSGKKGCGIIFNIEKAYDKILHQGLSKIEIKIPPKIAHLIKEFLKSRTFFVQVNGKNSSCKPIRTG
jgi:hypothetical protein